MVRESWNDTELSAYLDGQLAPRQKAKLAADLTRDAALQRRLLI
jgi:anti-sigma factor RsiW